MKTKTNIQTLKAMINANELETLRLATCGVQAYNVFDGQEYTNIISVEKRGGRYYFIDVVGNSALISRYHDAERVCGEFIALYNEELAVVREYIKAMKKHGKVAIKAALWSKFYDECEAQGVKAEYIEGSIIMVHTATEDYVVESHRLISGGNDEPKDETKADEPKADETKDAPKADARIAEELADVANDEQGNTMTAEDVELFAAQVSTPNAFVSACKVLAVRARQMFAKVGAVVKAVALKAWQGVGIALTFAATLCYFFAVAWSIGQIIDVLGIGGTWSAFLVFIPLLFTVGLDLMTYCMMWTMKAAGYIFRIKCYRENNYPARPVSIIGLMIKNANEGRACTR